MAASSIVILVLGIVFALVVAFFISATLLRLAVKIVAHFAPGYWNILLTYIVAGVVVLIASVGMSLAGLTANQTIGSRLFHSAAFYVLNIVVYGVMLKDRSGGSLGIFNAFLADLLRSLMTLLLAGMAIAAAMGIYGYQPVLDTIDRNYQQGQAVVARMQAAAALAAARAAATPTPSQVPNVSQLLQQTPPGPARYFLKNPITIPVAYGQMTYPANTEVRLLRQNGDTCEIQLGATTYTLSRTQLVTAPQ